MKYLKPSLYALIPLIGLIMIGSSIVSGTDTRGDRQFSFGRSSSGAFSVHSDDSVRPIIGGERETQHSGDEAARSDAQSPTHESRQRAGQSGAGSEVRTRVGGDLYDPFANSTQYDARQGKFPGQMSNVPGSTTTSPNGTSSMYGTGGIPIFPQDTSGNGKGGYPGE